MESLQLWHGNCIREYLASCGLSNLDQRAGRGSAEGSINLRIRRDMSYEGRGQMSASRIVQRSILLLSVAIMVNFAPIALGQEACGSDYDCDGGNGNYENCRNHPCELGHCEGETGQPNSGYCVWRVACVAPPCEHREPCREDQDQNCGWSCGDRIPGCESDYNPCTSDLCVDDACQYVPNQDGPNSACDDGISCTEDICQSGACANPIVVSVCDDGNVCNGEETCNPQNGCVGGTPLVCNDNNVCNGVETCNSQSGCVRGVPLDCDDGNPCTDDSCDGEIGRASCRERV